MRSSYCEGRESERIVAKFTTGKSAILVEWLSIPTVFAIFFLMSLPAIVKTVMVSAAEEAFLQAIGAEEISFGNVFFNLFQVLMPSAARWVTTTIQISVMLLFFVWLGVMTVRTILHFGYEIVLTDRCVFARTRNESFECEWKDLKNVYIEQSIWGRLLHYGNVILQGPSNSVTVRHIASPETITELFRQYTKAF